MLFLKLARQRLMPAFGLDQVAKKLADMRVFRSRQRTFIEPPRFIFDFLRLPPVC